MISAPSRTKIILAFALTIFVWSSALVFIRVALKSYDPGSLALFRCTVSSLGMIFVYWKVHHLTPTKVKDIFPIFVAGLMGFGLYNLVLNYGEMTVSAGVAGFIISQMPVAITLLAILFLGERLAKKAWLGMCISLLGVLIIALSHHHAGKFDLGILYLLTAVIAGSIYNVMYKNLLHQYGPAQLTAYGIWAGTLSLAYYFPTLWREIPTATLAATGSAVYLGLFPGLIGFLSWSYALRHVPACKAGSAFYVMPLVTAFLGWISLREMPPLMAFIGGLTALSGAVLMMLSKTK